MRKHMSAYIQSLAEQLGDIMDTSGASWDQMQRALKHACNSDGSLQALEATTEPLQILWYVDVDVDLVTAQAIPAQAAVKIWQRVFHNGPTPPGGDQACVFDIVEARSGKQCMVDLARPEFRHLFTSGSEQDLP